MANQPWTRRAVALTRKQMSLLAFLGLPMVMCPGYAWIVYARKIAKGDGSIMLNRYSLFTGSPAKIMIDHDQPLSRLRLHLIDYVSQITVASCANRARSPDTFPVGHSSQQQCIYIYNIYSYVWLAFGTSHDRYLANS